MTKHLTAAILVIAFAACVSVVAGQQPPRGVTLEQLAWPEAERVLGAETVVVIPLGAASKEHGPHLKLRNDLTLAEYLAKRVVDAADVVVGPTIPYHYYPAFLEYPGSTSLTLDTARMLTNDIVRTLSAYGPRRFYVLNTGISTLRPLQASARELAAEGLLLGYTDLSASLDAATRQVRQQEGGSHADEIETSMMLYIAPGSVDMQRAVKDYTPSSPGMGLTRRQGGRGTYSPTGTWGDPTLATREKGRVLTEALVTGILADLERVRRAPLPIPQARPAAGEPATAAGAVPRPGGAARSCTPQDDRTIRQVGDAFTLHWTNQDAEKLAGLWSIEGDLVHPDESIEAGRRTIMSNRAALFMRREYRGSRHPLAIRRIRCLTPDVAVADGRWELRGVSDADGKPLPTFEGQATLVLKRDDRWLIEAYRYTIKPSSTPPPPMWFKRPGVLDKTP